MGDMRTRETREKYLAFIAKGGNSNGCNLCSAPSLKEFEHWRIVDNDFPYDLVAQTTHMIVPKRHVDENGLTNEEIEEYKTIKKTYLVDYYNCIYETVPRRQSIRGHYHLILMVFYE